MLTKTRYIKTGTAIAVITMLGACASSGTGYQAPKTPLEKIGNTATETGSRIWAGTRHLFKLKDHSKDNQLAEEYFDEIDLAAGDVAEYEDTIAGVDTTAVQPLPEVELLGENSQSGQSTEVTLVDAENEALQAADAQAQQSVASSEQYPPGNDDLFHTVGDNESIWLLAKMLTGDANNWPVLAEINGLGENGAVQVGERIRIPGKLKRVPVDGQEQVVAAANTEASPATEQAATEQTQNAPTQTFKVNAGENMWFLAKRTTGNAANWTKIAEANGMDESQASLIRYGQEIEVPVSLLSADIAQASDQQNTAAADAVADAITPQQAQSLADEDNAATAENAVVLASASDLPADKQLVTVEANYQGNPAKLELARNAEQVDQPAAAIADTEADSDGIMVSGTYYPKAVYNKADFSSSLLMRVSPGTRLEVSKAIGPWYEVMTDKGVGYVHSRDTK